MEALETVGLILVAVLFAYSGYNHVRNHDAMARMAGKALGPAAKGHAYIGGWPTGVVLIVIAVGLLMESVAAVIAATIFLVITQIVFHRDLTDPANMKHLALIGSLLVIIACSW